MHKTLLLQFMFVGMSFYASAQHEVDSMCGAKVILDTNGKLLSRYVKAVELAVEFWKNCPVSPDNKLPLYLTHCSMYRDGKGGYYGSA